MVLALQWILTAFENFAWFTVTMPIQGCGAASSRRLFGGVGLLTTQGSESDILSDSDSGSPIGSLLHHTRNLTILVESVQFLMKILLQQIIRAVYHVFHWVLVATKLLTAKLYSLDVKELELEISERSELESDILPPTPQPWMPYMNDGLY